MYAKDPYEAKYQFLINKRESTALKHFNDPKIFIEYSNGLKDVYKDINEYNIDKERKILIVFEDGNKLNSILTELFIRGRKLNISLLFITQSYPIIPIRFQNMLDWILLTFLSQKFQTKENFNKLH